MRINTNILSLSAQRQLSTTTKALARAMERLASGSRVNSARDDAAGLAIGNGLEAQRRGMTQAIRNMNDARGFLNTADGALAEQANIIQRMRELALQAANGTLSDTDRGNINREFQQLFSEIDRIAEMTEISGVKPLTQSQSFKLQVGASANQTIDINLSNSTTDTLFDLDSEIDSGTTTGTMEFTTNSYNYARVSSFSFGDYDEDGKVDLLRGNQTANGLTRLHLGNGNGTFSSANQFSDSTGYPYGARDFDGDGHLDILSGSTTTDAWAFYLGNGNGTFQAALTFAGLNSVYLSDADEDGILDAISIDASSVLAFSKGNGNGTFQTAQTIGIQANSLLEHVTDLNGDSHVDIIASGNIYFGDGTGNFVHAQSTSGTQAALGDLNNDGLIDLITTTRTYIQTPSHSFNQVQAMAVASAPRLGDVNNDGILDALYPEANFLSLYLGNGDGTMALNRTIAYTSTGNKNGALADVNGDGFIDIMGGGHSGLEQLDIHLQNTVTTYNETVLSLTLETQSAAEDALEFLTEGIERISASRADIGAQLNRLDYAESNARTMVENISAAKSQVLDTDYASEMAEFTRLQILQEAGLSVLSQANMNAKIALKLLQNL